MKGRAIVFGAAGAALAMLARWYLLLFSPQSTKLQEREDRLIQAEQQRDDLRIRLATLKKLKEQEPEKRLELGELEQLIPGQPKLADFLIAANDAARLAGVEYPSVSQSEPGPAGEGTPGAMAISITANGSYAQALDFVDRLRALPRLLVVDSVSLNPGGGDGKMSLSIAARIFVSGVAPEPAPADPAAPPASA